MVAQQHEIRNPVEPDNVDINVCDQGMTLFEIVPLKVKILKSFRYYLKAGLNEAAKLLCKKRLQI